ncbi:hypothetical protein NMG60_11008169 [Bertholletia excelsa]
MSCIQVNAVNFRNLCHLSGGLSMPYATTVHVNQLPASSLKLICCASKYRQSAPVCLFGGKGKSEQSDKGSPWSALEKAMGNLNKKQSIEDVLKEQMAKQEYYDEEGSSGGDPPGGRGRGGGGGGGAGESEDEGFSGIMDEALQVTLATLGFVFLYIYIIEGEDITRLVQDLIKFVFTRKKSLRLQRLMDEWGSFFQSLKRKESTDPYWLERAILLTPTSYDSPNKYRRMLKPYLRSRSDCWS